MKIRLHGSEEDCREAAERLGLVLTVMSVSEPYPDRGQSVLARLYVEAQIDAPPGRLPADPLVGWQMTIRQALRDGIRYRRARATRDSPGQVGLYQAAARHFDIDLGEDL